MKQKISRAAALGFLLAAVLLSACAKAPAEPAPAENTPEAALPEKTPAPEPATPTPEPRPEPTPEPWREAYKAVAEQCEREQSEWGSDYEITYDLIDIDGDEIPELSAELDICCVSLYTYAGGEARALMDRWIYGAMGNYGYEYCPGKNSLRNYNSDYAGLVMNTTYLSVGPECTLDVTAQIETRNFNDVNGNGYPDTEAEYEFVENGPSFVNGVEISAEEAASYNVGEYEYISGRWSFDELMAELGK